MLDKLENKVHWPIMSFPQPFKPLFNSGTLYDQWRHPLWFWHNFWHSKLFVGASLCLYSRIIDPSLYLVQYSTQEFCGDAVSFSEIIQKKIMNKFASLWLTISYHCNLLCQQSKPQSCVVQPPYRQHPSWWHTYISTPMQTCKVNDVSYSIMFLALIAAL